MKSLPLLEAEAKERQGARSDLKHSGKSSGKLNDDVQLAAFDLLVDEAADAFGIGDARDQAAKTVGVSGKLVSDAKRVQREAPENYFPLGKIWIGVNGRTVSRAENVLASECEPPIEACKASEVITVITTSPYTRPREVGTSAEVRSDRTSSRSPYARPREVGRLA